MGKNYTVHCARYVSAMGLVFPLFSPPIPQDIDLSFQISSPDAMDSVFSSSWASFPIQTNT